MPAYTDAKGQKHPRSIDAFCERNGICRASFYNLVKRGEAPDVLKIGASIRITEQAEAAWLLQRQGQHVPASRQRAA